MTGAAEQDIGQKTAHPPELIFAYEQNVPAVAGDTLTVSISDIESARNSNGDVFDVHFAYGNMHVDGVEVEPIEQIVTQEHSNGKLSIKIVMRKTVPLTQTYLVSVKVFGTVDVAPRPSVVIPKFKVGSPVKKAKGYGFPGNVRAVYWTLEGELRYVVQLVCRGVGGLQHIFNEDQIEAAPPSQSQDDLVLDMARILYESAHEDKRLVDFNDFANDPDYEVIRERYMRMAKAAIERAYKED